MHAEQSPAAVRSAVTFLGGPPAVARLRNLKSPWSVAKWVRDGIPADHVIWLSEMTGWRYTPHQLAPALYPHPHDGLPPQLRTAAFLDSPSPEAA